MEFSSCRASIHARSGSSLGESSGSPSEGALAAVGVRAGAAEEGGSDTLHCCDILGWVPESICRMVVLTIVLAVDMICWLLVLLGMSTFAVVAIASAVFAPLYYHSRKARATPVDPPNEDAADFNSPPQRYTILNPP
jgi:hypothetical protein